MARILVVDDSELARSLISDALSKAGHETRTASSGREALGLLGASAFDLLVSDFVMPEMNGEELIGHVRKKHPGLPVLVVSSYYGSEFLPVEKNPGDGLLRKPFKNEELLGEVSRLLPKV